MNALEQFCYIVKEIVIMIHNQKNKWIYPFIKYVMRRNSNDNKHYIVSKLFEGGYVNGYVIPKNNFETFRRANITSLTLKGHDMVDNISNDTIWNGVKDKIKSGGRVSISILSQIVGETAAAYSKKMMGIE